ncbi:MAG: hypothetical protein HY897_14380, partial [Deltaproteobacteria bacterium]|nr:hypothetical protein [Deltaproteobacteria bacterium]
GLTYNLLTAYTSFVAIDSEVRNKTGQQTTVKQPLPLPEGVSNYAVGGAQGFAASAPAPAATTGYYAPPRAARSAVMKAKEHVAYGKADAMKMEAAPSYDRKLKAVPDAPAKLEEAKTVKSQDDADGTGMTLRTVELKVSGGLSNETAARVVESRLHELAGCPGLRDLRGKLVLSVTVRADGTVREVKVVSGLSVFGWSAKHCIQRVVGKWGFAPSPDSRESTVTITFEQVR